MTPRRIAEALVLGGLAAVLVLYAGACMPRVTGGGIVMYQTVQACPTPAP